MSILQQMPTNFSSSFLSQVNNTKVITERITNSKQVSKVPCLLLGCDICYVQEDEYVSPTIFADPYGVWDDEENCYDGNLATKASTSVDGPAWSEKLRLSVADEILCSGIGFYAPCSLYAQSIINLDYYYNGEFFDLYQGGYPDKTWTIKSFTDPIYIKELVVYFYNSVASILSMELYEIAFLRRKVFDVCFYDGFNTSDFCKHRVVQGFTGNRNRVFYEPLVFSKGLYLDFVEEVGCMSVRYLPLGV